MLVKTIINEDLNNYKKLSMLIAFPYCTFKCNRECGLSVCQNSELTKSKNIDIPYKKIVSRYLSNAMTNAIVMGGLEPLDSWEELWYLICEFRHYTLDDIVIYTGYTEEEVYSKMHYIINNLKQFPNIIIKFGRFIPNQKPHYDEILGVKLISDNQYAKKIS